MPSRVTVLMAVYNGAAYLRHAVDSILLQSFRDFEFLIIDDGSTDESREILNSYDDPRIRILDNPRNIGLTRSLNRGLAEARGDLIARQDADDVSHRTRIEKQVAFMNSHPAIALLGTQAKYLAENGQTQSSRMWWKATTPAGIRFQMLFDSPFFHTAVMFRRRIVWECLGGYDETFVTSQDFELWSRMLKGFHATNLTEALVHQRVHAGTVSSSYSPSNAHHVGRVFQANLESILGHQQRHIEWPSVWISATNPRMGETYDLSTVLNAIDGIYDDYLKSRFPPPSLAEIHLQYASKLLFVSRLMAHSSPVQSMKAFIRAYKICPSLIVEELPRISRGLLMAGKRSLFGVPQL